MIRYITILINIFVLNCYAFNNINVFKSSFKDTNIKIYKKKDNNKNDKNLIFYSGGNNMISEDIYSNFLRTLASTNYNVYALSNNDKYNKELLNELKDSTTETILIGHSSGCVNLLLDCNDNNFINKLILMDPVNNIKLYTPVANLFLSDFKKDTDFKLEYIKDILLLNAEKSYDWSFYPSFNIPFIPGFSINKNDIIKISENINVKLVKANEYGHTDILNPIYSDFMHKTISKGNEERDEEKMYNYYIWIAEEIHKFLNPVSIIDNNKIIEI